MGGFSSYVIEQENVKKQQDKQKVVSLEEKSVKKPTKKPIEQKSVEVLEPVAKEEE